MLENLEWVVQGALEADKIRGELHDRIYQVIDPDTGKPTKNKKHKASILAGCVRYFFQEVKNPLGSMGKNKIKLQK